METAPGDFESPIKSPILELVFDKSKVNTGFDGQIYYFHPASGQVAIPQSAVTLLRPVRPLRLRCPERTLNLLSWLLDR